MPLSSPPPRTMQVASGGRSNKYLGPLKLSACPRAALRTRPFQWTWRRVYRDVCLSCPVLSCLPCRFPPSWLFLTRFRRVSALAGEETLIASHCLRMKRSAESTQPRVKATPRRDGRLAQQPLEIQDNSKTTRQRREQRLGKGARKTT